MAVLSDRQRKPLVFKKKLAKGGEVVVVSVEEATGSALASVNC